MQNKMPKISVIMPVYKTEEILLRKAIGSIIIQSYQEIELILIDDGSPDKCGVICDYYALIDNRIRVIHKKNGGVSSARNSGLENVSGEYIFFVDSDDMLKKNALEVLFLAAQKTNSDITICSCRHVKDQTKGNVNHDEEQEIFKTVKTADAIKILSYNTHVFEELEPTAVWGKLYKKRILQNLKFNENMSLGEDFVFNYFAICNASTVTYCNLKLYDYNFVETSLMNNKTYSPKLMKSFEELVKFEKSQCDEDYSNDLIARCVNIAFSIYFRVSPREHDELKKIENYIQENRKNVLSNKKATRKTKIACCISYVSFKLVVLLFDIINNR